MAEVSDLLQGQTSSRTHDHGETPLGKASQSLVTPVSGCVMDSDPQKGNSPDKSMEEHGLKSQSRNSNDTQRVEARELMISIHQNRVRSPKLRTY